MQKKKFYKIYKEYNYKITINLCALISNKYIAQIKTNKNIKLKKAMKDLL